ncbi:uncharacterized protein LOC119952915 [Scyliorhinus canicula]|uniref:uncharacterized protein LOC119952915 n=1 Tax=Scyliorhinus canicula TaxID=7830 RepID=UPI0018F5D23B|nr:uncharacterized protein LOC119952915 [Scyliorhinus canicula]
MPKSTPRRKTTRGAQRTEQGQTRKTTISETDSKQIHQKREPNPRKAFSRHTGHGKQRSGVRHSGQLQEEGGHQGNEEHKWELEDSTVNNPNTSDRQSQEKEQILGGTEKTMGGGGNEKSKKIKGKKKQQPEKIREPQKVNLKELKTSEKKFNEKKKGKERLKPGRRKVSEDELEKSEGGNVSNKVHSSTGKGKEKGNKARRNENKGKKFQTFNEANDSSKSDVKETVRPRSNSRAISNSRPVGKTGRSRNGISNDPSNEDSESLADSSKEPNNNEESTNSEGSITDLEDSKASSRRDIHQRKARKKDSDHSTESESAEEEGDKRETGDEETGKEGIAEKTVTSEKGRGSSEEDNEENDSMTSERGSQSKLYSCIISQNPKDSTGSKDERQEDKQGDSDEESDNEEEKAKKQMRSLGAAENDTGGSEKILKRKTLQMNVKKKLLMGVKVKAKEESKGTGRTETKQESKTREKFLKVQVQHKYQSRMHKVIKENTAAKQGDQFGDEQSTDVKTIPSCNILAHQSHLIHSFRTKSRNIKARSKQPLISAAAEGGLTQMVKVAVKVGKTQQGASVQEKATEKTSGKERRRQSSSTDSSDAEGHLEEDQTPSPQHLKALLHQKKIAKVVGKVKLASIRKRKTRTLKAEGNTTVADVIQPEPGSPRIEGKSNQPFAVIRRVTGWLCRQIPKMLKSRSKLVTVTKVIGTTEWLSKTLSVRRKNKHGKPGGFRRCMAIRFASTAGQVSQKGITNRDLKVGGEGACRLLVVNNTTPSSMDDAEVIAPDDIELVPEMEGNGQNKHHQSEDQSEPEEKFNSSDAKYAIVLPRVHRLVKSKATVLASCRSERARGGTSQPYNVAVSAQPEYLYMDVGKSQKRHSDKLHTLGVITQSNSERKTSKQPKDASLWKAKNIPHSKDGVTSPRLVNKLLRKDPEKRKITLPDHNPPVSSHLRTDPQQQITRAQGTEYFQDMNEIHWAQRGHFSDEHLTWLDSETLLPHLTVENLSKWTMYKEQDITRTPRRAGVWESEDTVEDILEKEFKYKQVPIQ